MPAHAPVRYDAQYGSMVFPLGMYSVAATVDVTDNALGFLLPLARFAGYVAFVARILAAAGLIGRLLRGRDRQLSERRGATPHPRGAQPRRSPHADLHGRARCGRLRPVPCAPRGESS